MSRLHVSATETVSTPMLTFHEGPPPWPRGACFSLSRVSQEERRRTGHGFRWEELLHVVNMHMENYATVIGELSLETVKIELVGAGQCLVVDRRIARKWLLDRPCGERLGGLSREEFLARHPNALHEAPR